LRSSWLSLWGVNHIDNCRDQFTPRCLLVTSEPVKKGAEVRKVKRCRTEDAIFLPQLEGTLEHGSCPERNRTLERFGQCAGVEGGSGGRQLCLLTFSHIMNQVKLSAPDCRRLKAKVIADPNKTARIPARRQIEDHSLGLRRIASQG